jgi:signal transduction histidine kinase/PAS domain-containing protein
MQIKSRLLFLALTASILFLFIFIASNLRLSLPISLELSSTVMAKSSLPVAPQPLVLTDEQGKYPIGLHLSILEDPGGELTIDQVTSPTFDSQFTPSLVAVPNYGYSNSAFWVRFKLDNESAHTSEWLLEQGFANTQYIDLYIPSADGGGFEVKQSGALRPVSTRDVIYPNVIFNLNLPTHSEQTYYLRIKSGSSMTIPLTLWTKNAFIVQSGQDLIVHWLIFGGFLALLVYHIFLLITLRETSYLYFVTMLASMLIFMIDYSGYLFVYLLPSQYALKYYFIPVYIAALYASIILFSDTFLELKTRLPKLHWVKIGLLAVWGGLVLLIPFLSYLDIARLMTPWQLVTIGATWIIGIIAWNKGIHPLRFFMLAWLGMAASIFLLLLVRLGILPSTAFDENIFLAGFILMAVSWSFALVDRINVLKEKTENANRDLRNSEQKLTQILEGLPLGVAVYGKDQKPTYVNQRTIDILSNPTLGVKPDASSGRTLEQARDYFSFHPPGSDDKYPLENLPVYKALNGTPASTDDIEMDQGGKRVPLEIWASPIKDAEGNVNAAVAIFQDITQRKLAEAELTLYQKQLEQLVNIRTTELDQVNQRLKLRLEWLDEVIKVQQMVKGVSSMAFVSEEMCTRIYQLLKPTSVFILRWDDKREQPEIYSCSQQDGCTPDVDTLNLSFQKGSPLQQVLESGKIIAWSADHGDSFPASYMQWCQEHDIQLSMFAPMLIGQSLFGVLGILTSKPYQDFILQETDLIERMALDLASLYQDAVLLDQTLALVALDERNRLARDLHDSVTQVLFTATLLTEVMPQIWRRDPEQGFQTLDKLRRLTRGALAEMRTMLIELRPSAVINTPLSELLAQLTEAITSRSGVPFQLFIEQIPILPDEVQMNFYRIAQEALNNVVKHAQAMHVSVSLNESHFPVGSSGVSGRIVKLVIEDDGVGFYSGTIQSGHLGIGIMRERAAAIQADLILESKPGHGTLVYLTWNSEWKPENQNE